MVDLSRLDKGTIGCPVSPAPSSAVACVRLRITPPKPQFTEVLDDGYLTLHPTKGFRRVSQRQVMGRQIIDQLKQAAMMKMLSRSPVAKTRRNDSAVYRGVGGAGPVRQRALSL